MTSSAAPVEGPVTTSPISLRALAVHGPLLLFTSGILRWVDGFDGRRGSGLPWVFAQVLLVGALLCFAGLSRVLVAEAHRLRPSSWALLAAGGTLVALTRELLPLTALLILIGLAPLTHTDQPEPESHPQKHPQTHPQTQPRTQPQDQGMLGSGQDSPVELSITTARSATTVRGSTSAMAVTTTGSCAPVAPVATETCGTHEPGS